MAITVSNKATIAGNSAKESCRNVMNDATREVGLRGWREASDVFLHPNQTDDKYGSHQQTASDQTHQRYFLRFGQYVDSYETRR